MSVTSVDQLLSQLSDMHSAETQLTHAIPEMSRAAFSRTLSAAFEQHFIETLAHVQRLDEAFEILAQTSQAGVSVAMQELIANGEATFAAGGERAVIDAALIDAAQKIEHYEIAAYQSLKALAAELGYDRVAMLLDQTLEEERAASVKLQMIADAEVDIAADSVDDPAH